MGEKRRTRPNVIPIRGRGATRKLSRWRKHPIIILAFVAFAVPVGVDLSLGVWRAAEVNGGHCRVVRIIDGDTLDMWCDRGLSRIRLLGYDTPELFSPQCSKEARQALAAKWQLRLMIWQGDRVALVREGSDRYDRVLGRMFIDDVPLSRRMIAESYARPYDGGAREGWCA